MNRPVSSLAVASLLAVCGHSGAAAQSNTANPTVVEGRCSYSDELAPLIEQGHSFVECDRLEMRGGGQQMELKFAHPARLRSLEFRGSFASQSRFEVSAIRYRSRNEWRTAEGQCEFNQSASNYSLVICLVRDGGRFFVVDFRPSG